MKIPIAIHLRESSFSDRWISYCKKKIIPYKIVNCYANNIISQLDGMQALLWHWDLTIPSDTFIARKILTAVEDSGIITFPNKKTCWHYDDKIGQKYLLESIGAPLVPTHVFFTKEDALNWCRDSDYPKVFKLSSGASSRNVKLIKNNSEAVKHVEIAFSKGFKHSGGYFSDARMKYKRVLQKKNYLGVLMRFPLSFIKKRARIAERGKEKNYIYFQDFIPNNQFDTRITVIGNRIFGFTRNVRENDFRASGSGSINYSLDRIDMRCVQTAFDITQKIGAQSLAFDFVHTANNTPLILEISYCYVAEAVYNCLGHWDEKMNWHQGHLWPQDAILEDLIEKIQF